MEEETPKQSQTVSIKKKTNDPKTGHFLPGNKASVGNPYAKKIHQFRAQIFKCVKAEDYRKVIETALRQAIDGDKYAREWLSQRIDPVVKEAIVAMANISGDDVKAKIASFFGLEQKSDDSTSDNNE